MFSVPASEEENRVAVELPPGLVLIEDFITPEEEILLLSSVNWNGNGKKFDFFITLLTNFWLQDVCKIFYP